MTAQPTRDQRDMWRQIATDAGDDPYANTLHPDEVLALLDQLDQAEARIDRWRDYGRTQRHRADDQEDRAVRAVANWDAKARRVARLEAQTSIRGRAVVMYRERAREAEARIEAVRAIHRDLYESMSGVPYCNECDRAWPCPTVRALEGWRHDT